MPDSALLPCLSQSEVRRMAGRFTTNSRPRVDKKSRSLFEKCSAGKMFGMGGGRAADEAPAPGSGIERASRTWAEPNDTNQPKWGGGIRNSEPWSSHILRRLTTYYTSNNFNVPTIQLYSMWLHPPPFKYIHMTFSTCTALHWEHIVSNQNAFHYFNCSVLPTSNDMVSRRCSSGRPSSPHCLSHRYPY